MRTPNLLHKYKTIFVWKQDKPLNSKKTFSLNWGFLWICFDVSQKPKSSFLSDWILVQGITIPSLVDKYKTVLFENRGKPWKSRKTLFYIVLPKNLFWSLSKAEMESCGPWNIGSRLWNAKFGWQIQNYFSGKAR